jgi:hypothetical protein
MIEDTSKVSQNLFAYSFDSITFTNPTGKIMKPLLREKYTGRKEAFIDIRK